MNSRYTFFTYLLFLFFFSCTKNEVPRPSNNLQKHKVAEAVLQGTAVKMMLYSEYDSLFVGYNPLYITLTDTATKTDITNASVKFLPVMDMITTKHSCPAEQPAYDNNLKSYSGAAAFIMATMGEMKWSIECTTVVNNIIYKNIFPVTVKSTGNNIKLVSSVLNQNQEPYYIVLVHPQKSEQKTGLNDLEVAVYKKNTMMDFSAADGMSLSFLPTMPSMGHSSPNNVNPMFTQNGHYKGKVNFTMTGDWRLDFTLSGNGNTFTDHAFLNILF